MNRQKDGSKCVQSEFSVPITLRFGRAYEAAPLYCEQTNKHSECNQ